MFCENCGKKVSDDAKFCDACGAFIGKNKGTALNDTPAKDNTKVFDLEAEPSEAELIQPVEDISPLDVDDDIVTEYVEPEIVQEQPSEEIKEAEESGIIPAQQEIEQSEAAVINEAESEIEQPPVDAPVIIGKTAKSYVGLVFSYILIFILVLAFVGALLFKVSFNGRQLSKDIKKANIIDMQVGTLVKSNDFQVDKKDTVEDIIYKSIQAYSDFDVSKDELDQIYSETDIKNYIADKTGEYVDFVVSGKDIDGITGDDLYKLVEDNKDKIEQIADIEIKDVHMDALKKYLDKDDNTLVTALSTKNIEKSLESNGIDKVTALLQDWVIYCALGGLAIFIVLMSIVVFKVNRNKGGSVVYLSSVVIAIGSILLLAGISLYVFTDKIVSLFGEAKGVADAFVPTVRGRLLFFGIIMLAAGIIAVVIKKLVTKSKAKRKARLDELDTEIIA